MHFIPSFTWEGFFLGPIYVYTWGLTAAIGVIVSVLMAERKIVSGQWSACLPALRQRLRQGEPARQVVSKKISENKFWNLTILLVITVFLGARIFYILETWNYYAANPLAMLRLWEGGFSFFGGAASGILAGYFWGKINKINFLTLSWFFTPAWLFGLFFGRVGCFLIHDHLGKPTDLPWGVFVAGAYRHEPAMYEAIWVLVLGVVLFLLDRKSNRNCHPERSRGIPLKKNSSEVKNIRIFRKTNFKGIPPLPPRLRSGFGRNDNTKDTACIIRIIFPLSLLLYSFGRFFIDFARADDPR
ncbi:MAG: prolipoprotein diacylglyceryl transferase, partial [Candidatus Moraniibacteriota bacterium]